METKERPRMGGRIPSEDAVYLVTAIVRVSDERALVDYAEQRVQASWSDSVHNLVGVDETLVERALVEALLVSNENPSPDEYGIEFYETRAQRLR